MILSARIIGDTLGIASAAQQRKADAIHARARIAKDGPYVGVRIWTGPPIVDGEELDRSPRRQVMVGNEITGRAVFAGDRLPVEVEGVTLRQIEEISEADYRFLVAHQEWGAATGKGVRAAPREAVDLRGPSLF